MNKRDEFSSSVKRKLASRAGYVCSFPDCNELTIGPASDEEGIVVSGEAAHITAASPKGPRYDPTMLSEERKSISNGIWMCKRHARIVDIDETQYTVPQLKKWRENHERKIKYQQQGIKVKKGILTKIKTSNIARMNEEENIELGKNTLLFGGVGSGKTIICELLAGLEEKHFLWRWKKKRNVGNTYAEIEIFDGEITTLMINIYEKQIRYYINNQEYPLVTSPYSVIYLHETFKYNSDVSKTFIEQYADYFNLTANDMINIINTKVNIGLKLVSDFYYKDKELLVRVDTSQTEPLPYKSLSSSEKQRVNIEIGSKIAHVLSYSKPTMLIIEHDSTFCLDEYNMKKLLTEINSNRVPYQTLLTAYSFDDTINLDNFTIYEHRQIGGIVKIIKK
ncbi:hypothetical protein [Bacillus paranthracis]|uniref:hypothetical protein n=1 Tax=Bacillus paranthracis TaxID=2026186 RepID=UPI0018CEA0F3|nr:hypothetical protein [Bacillus paranthracis]